MESQTATLTINAPDDAEVGETRTFTIAATIDGEPIGGVETRVVKLMDIITPKEGNLYLAGIRIPFPWTVIIGPIKISVNADDFECGIFGVEFYIDNVAYEYDTEPPFEWNWKKASLLLNKHKLKVVTYSNCGGSASRELTLWKLF
jgi:hypothetical protein